MAEKVKLIGLPNIRISPNSMASITTNELLFDVLDIHGDYYKCKVIKGSDNINKIGWVWVKRLDIGKSKKEAIVTEDGVSMRMKPSVKSDKICFIKSGALVEILDCNITWYKISLGWIYKSMIKIVK